MLPFTDVKQGDWYYADVKIAYQNRLINGKTDTLFAPQDNMIDYLEMVLDDEIN